MFLVRETIPDALAVRIQPYGGTPARWSMDEGRVEDVISDLVITDEMPGGHKTMNGTLARNPHLVWPDLDAYADIEVYAPGVEEVWAGRLDKAPDQSGDHMSINPEAVGWQHALEDDKAAMLGIVSRAVSDWEQISQQDRVVYERDFAYFDWEELPAGKDDGIGQAAGGGGINLLMKGEWSQWARCIAVFDAGPGLKVAEVFFDTWYVNANWGGSWFLLLHSTDFPKDVYNTLGAGVDYDGVSNNVYAPAPVSGKRALLWEWAYNSGGGGNEQTYAAQMRKMAVYADHGLTKRDSSIAALGTGPGGFFAKDILGYAVPRLAPPLTVDATELQDDGYVIKHAWWKEPTTMAEIVKNVLRTSLYDWFVFENKKFQIKKPGTYGRLWKTTVRDSQLNELGLDASRLWEKIVVRYQDVDGTTKTVGPVGSNVEVTDSRLQITDPDHPAVRAPVNRQDILVMSGVSVPSAAIAVGQQFLAEANLLSRSGSATLSHYVLDEYGTQRPASQVKSGDWLSIVDAADTSYRKIVQKTYAHNERAANVDLDAPPQGLQALLERLQADLIPAGLG